MYILEKIIKTKSDEVAKNKELYPTKFLEQSIFFDSKPISLKEYILREDKDGIIAEFKRKSPSQGSINRFASVEKTSIGYMQAGASALSVLTDSDYFGGSNKDLEIARKYNYCPILRKEFIIDEYQIIEAKSIGADAILLIASVLSSGQLRELSSFAHGLGLEVLIEAHDQEEIEKSLEAGPQLLGINNRNLKNFEVNIDNSAEMISHIPDGVVKIAESGIKEANDVRKLREAGFDGFLIGQLFMNSTRPEVACKKFIDELRK